jgi:hypothetical protein
MRKSQFRAYLAERAALAIDSDNPRRGVESHRLTAPEPCGTQHEIIDAILAAFPHLRGVWLSAKRQVELLSKAHQAQLPDGRSAFPALERWDGRDRTNRLKAHVQAGKALKCEGKNLYMLASGVAPFELGVSQAVVDALATYDVIPRYDVRGDKGVVQSPEQSGSRHTASQVPIPVCIVDKPQPPEVAQDEPTERTANDVLRSETRDGLNSSILPASSGSSGGIGLPPRTHAIHKVLFESAVPLSLGEIEARLNAWGYDRDTVRVTRNHLRSLCVGWGSEGTVAVQLDDQGRYSLTLEGRNKLAAGPFSVALT